MKWLRKIQIMNHVTQRIMWKDCQNLQLLPQKENRKSGLISNGALTISLPAIEIEFCMKNYGFITV